MEPETLIGYLLAFAVPLWLLAEGVMVSRRSPRQSARRLEPGRPSRKPASRAPVRAAVSPRA